MGSDCVELSSLFKDEFEEVRSFEQKLVSSFPKVSDIPIGEVVTIEDHDFKVIKKLGEGTEASVYLAINENGKEVVIKDFFKITGFDYLDLGGETASYIREVSFYFSFLSSREDEDLLKKFEEYLNQRDFGLIEFFSTKEIHRLKDLIKIEAKRLAEDNASDLKVLRRYHRNTVEIIHDFSSSGVLVLEYIDGVSLEAALFNEKLSRSLALERRFKSLEDKFQKAKELSLCLLATEGCGDLFSREEIKNLSDHRWHDAPFPYNTLILEQNVILEKSSGELIIIDPH